MPYCAFGISVLSSILWQVQGGGHQGIYGVDGGGGEEGVQEEKDMDNYHKDKMPKGGDIKESALAVDDNEDLEKTRDVEWVLSAKEKETLKWRMVEINEAGTGNKETMPLILTPM